MKKQIAIVLVAAGSIAAATAAGRDVDNRANNRGNAETRVERMEEFLEDADITTVTGKLELVNDEPAKIVSKGVTYTVRAPWQELLELELKDGQTVTFKGVEKQPRYNWDGSEKTLIVTSIVMGDKEITIDFDKMGPKGGRAGGRGNGERADKAERSEKRGN